jgi:predicted site-specific integrase-resolvase
VTQRQRSGNNGGNSGYVTTQVAAEALGVAVRTVRNYLRDGLLQGKKEEEGITERYLVSIDSVQKLRDQRQSEGKVRRSIPSSAAQGHSATQVVREFAAKMQEQAMEIGALRTRLELTERAESSLREDLERERRQRQEDVQRERAERLEAQQRVEQLAREHVQLEEEHSRVEREAQQLQEELEAERSKGFWARLFGG